MSSTPGRCWPGAFGVFMAVGFLLGSVGEETWGGGWHWDAVAFADFESTLAVFGSVWILGVAQRRLNRGFRRALLSIGALAARLCSRAWSCSSSLSSCDHSMVRQRSRDLIVAAGGVAGSFALAWLRIRRI